MATLSTTILTTVEPGVQVTLLPFLFRGPEHVAAFMTSKAFETQRDILVKSRGLRMLAAWDYMPSNLYSNKPINQLGDIKGLKMRVPPSPAYVKLLQALGANPTPIPLGELYTSLQTGLVEGTNGIDDMMHSMKLSEVLKYVIATNHQVNFGNPTISEAFYESLPPDIQQALTEAAVEAGAWNHQQIIKTTAGLQDLLEADGMTIIHVSDFPKWQEAASPLYGEYTEKYGTELLDQIRDLKDAGSEK
jgi:TRAP-type C4-dicarboxylate transport system substrate-binding protein